MSERRVHAPAGCGYHKCNRWRSFTHLALSPIPALLDAMMVGVAAVVFLSRGPPGAAFTEVSAYLERWGRFYRWHLGVLLGYINPEEANE